MNSATPDRVASRGASGAVEGRTPMTARPGAFIGGPWHEAMCGVRWCCPPATSSVVRLLRMCVLMVDRVVAGVWQVVGSPICGYNGTAAVMRDGFGIERASAYSPWSLAHDVVRDRQGPVLRPRHNVFFAL